MKANVCTCSADAQQFLQMLSLMSPFGPVLSPTTRQNLALGAKLDIAWPGAACNAVGGPNLVGGDNLFLFLSEGSPPD